MGELVIRPAGHEDAPALLASFNSVFAEPGDAPRSLAEWRWAYAANPAGRRAFAAFDGARAVAHYAALPVRALLAGRKVVLGQVVDSFALPAYRGAAGGEAFGRTAQAFFEAHGGRDDALYYGWPIERAWRVGARALGYEAVRTQSALVLDVGGRAQGAPEDVERLTSFDEQALWLFERCAPRFSCAAVRDADYLTWRFLKHPRRHYEIYGLRDGAGILRGLAVYRAAKLQGSELGWVADWLVPEEEPEVGRQLFDALVARAEGEGRGALVAWLPERSEWFARFQEWGCLVHPTPWRMAARSFTPRIDPAWLREDGWYTLADSDLI
jgi:hypothetical protein